MSVTNVAAFTTVVLVFLVGGIYCLRFLRGEIAPRVATWLIFEIGVAMSLASYLSGKDHSLTNAALNVADCLQVTVISAVLLFGRKNQELCLTSNERLSLWISGLAGLGWPLPRRVGLPLLGSKL